MRHLKLGAGSLFCLNATDAFLTHTSVNIELHLQSLLRRQESSFASATRHWIPAFAGITPQWAGRFHSGEAPYPIL